MKMPTPVACRMCLSFDTRMYTIANTPLQKIFEKMTGIVLQSEDGRPVLACYICHHLLKRSETFIERSVRADELLKDILCRGLQITEKSVCLLDRSLLGATLTITPTHTFILEVESETNEVPVKVELCPVKRETEVLEDVKDDYVAELDTIEDPAPLEDQHSSSSEDDVPLKAFSTKKVDKKIDKKHKAKVKKQNSEESKKLLEHVSEIYPTKEEQLAEVLDRAKSQNYLNSPYKCSLCYKGFVDATAFKNHNDKHDESSGQFECDVCRLRYRTERLLRTHALTSHGRKYQCGKCNHRSHTANQAREHERWHNGHTYECQLCSHTFRKPTSYLTHMRKRHPTSHVCGECGLSFVGRHGLLMHRSKAHRGHEKSASETEEVTVCVECDIQFKSKEAWQRHILTSVKHSTGNGNCVLCPPCGAKFANRSKLQAHVKRMHLGLKYVKNMVCELCGKNCTSNASLKYHQRTHTGERPFPCTLCAKRFADRNQLRIHSRTHSGERPYCCAVCGRRFGQKPALNRHYRTHTGAKPYACQLCAKSFSQSNSLKLHVRAVHLKLPQNKKKTDQPQDS